METNLEKRGDPHFHRASLGMWLVMAALGCSHLPARPVPDRSVAAPPAFLKPVFAGWGFESWERPDLGGHRYRVEDIRFHCYCDALGRYQTLRGQIFLPEHEGPFPLIVVSPILGGSKGNYLECRVLGRAAARRGYASFYLYQEKLLLKPYRDATELERHLESWVRSTIRCLDLVLEHYPVDRNKLGSFGISLGGIRNVLLMAAEPRLRANVVWMAGGGLEKMFRYSRETLVTRYLARRRETALCARERLLIDLRQNLYSDPLHVAASVDPDRMLYFLARFDNKVPVATGWDLYEALGRPETLISPLGHYSSILVLPWAIGHSFDYFERSFAGPELNSNAGPNQ